MLLNEVKELLDLLEFIKDTCVQIQDEGDAHSNSLATEILEKIYGFLEGN